MSNIFFLGLVSFFNDISSEMIYPLIPSFLTITLGASPAILGVIEGVSESLGSLLKLFSGYYSDKIKQRKLIALWGYFTSLFGKLLLAFSFGWLMVFAARFFDRLGKGIRTAPRDALLAESSQGNKNGAAFGFHRSMDTAGAILGVLITIFLIYNLKMEFRSVFFYALIPAEIGIFILYFYVKDKMKKEVNPETENTEKKEKTKFIKIFSKWSTLPQQLRIFIIITFIFSLGNSSNMFLLLRSIDIGFTPFYTVFLYLAMNFSYLLFTYPASRLSDKIGRKSLLICGYLLYSVVYIAFAMIDIKFMHWLLFPIYGIYIGLTEGVEKAFVADHSSSDIKATAQGWHAFVVGVMLLPASSVAGFLWYYLGPSSAFYLSSITGFVSAILIFFYIKGGKPQQLN